MAQWMGQYTGRNHASKVKRKEDSLRKAVISLKLANEDEKMSKEKAVRKLAKSLLSSRLKMIRARISVLKEPQQSEPLKKTQQLRRKEQELVGKGVNGILKEFHAIEDT
jgi:hypothetical protein